MKTAIRVTKDRSKESAFYFESTKLVAKMPNSFTRIKPDVKVLGFDGKKVACHVTLEESNKSFFHHDGFDSVMSFDEDFLFPVALMLQGESVKEWESTKKSGVTVKYVDVLFKGEMFTIGTGSSFTFKTKGRWNPDSAGSSDGLRPEIECGGVQLSETESCHFKDYEDLKRLKSLLS